MASCYIAAGLLDRATPLREHAVQLSEAMHGTGATSTYVHKIGLADCYRQSGRLAEALTILEDVLAGLTRLHGASHPHTMTCLYNLALCHCDAHRFDKAEPLLDRVLRWRRANLGLGHPMTLLCINLLATNYLLTGRVREAIALYEEGYPAARKRSDAFRFRTGMIDAYFLAGMPTEADTVADELLLDARAFGAADDLQLAGVLAAVGLAHLRGGRHAKAEAVLRECLALREKKQPDAWLTLNTKSMLGGALLGQKKYTEAEPLLLKGYNGLRQREKTIPPQGLVRLPEALDRLVEFSAATDRPDDVKKWRAERAKYPEAAPMPREKK